MTRDDERERDEDPMLQSMRSVWLSMRDEEPSSKGLDALLAAARTKAVEMQPKPAWWQTLFATLRRPPVLALATVVVLVSGALLIGKRDATPVVDNTPAEVEPPRKPQVAASEPRASNDVRPREETAKQPPAALGKDSAGDGIERLERSIEQQRLPTQNNLSPPPRIPPNVAQGSAAAQPPVVRNDPPPPPSPPSLESNDPGKKEGEDGQKTPVAQGGLVVTESATVNTTDKKVVDEVKPGRLEIADDHSGATKAPTSAGDGFGMDPSSSGGKVRVKATTKPPPRGPTIEQLIQQAQTAASRGDCAAARVTAERIKKTDADTYRTRVEKNAGIARCLSK